jgi:hypothetical protein
MEGAGILVEAVYLALAALGVATVGLGLQGFGARGVPFGFGLQVGGRAGRALGVLLVLLGLALMAPAAWFWGSLWSR